MERRESHRDNKGALTTHPATGGERENHYEPITVCVTTHQLQMERRGGGGGGEVIETIKCMPHHTPATGGEERES